VLSNKNCANSHGQGNRPSGQSKTAIKIAATATKMSTTAIVVGRIGCLTKFPFHQSR